MLLNREEFLSALESVVPGLSTRGELEQSASFVFRDGDIITYNGEVCCTCPSPLGDVEGAVQAGPVLTVLRKMNSDEVKVDAADGQFVIRGKGHRKSNLRMDQEILLPLSGLEPPKEWKTLHEEFGEAVSVVKECAGKDVKRFLTTCIHVHPNFMEAFDNFQMVRYNFRTGLEKPVLVRRDALKHVATMGASLFGETRGWIHFRNPSKLVVACRRFVEPFVDLSANLVMDGHKLTLPKSLMGGLEIADELSKVASEEGMVLVSLNHDEMRIYGEGSVGWYSEKKSVEFDGTTLQFAISPKLLRRIIEENSEAMVGKRLLKVDGGRWVFVAVLGLVQKRME